MKKLITLSIVVLCNLSLCCYSEDFYGNTSIEDVIKAPKGGKIENFGKYLDSPDGIRTMGIFFGSYNYNNKTGRWENTFEERARYKEEQQYKQKKLEIMQDAFRSIED